MTFYTSEKKSYIGTPEQAEGVHIGENFCKIIVPTGETGNELGLFGLSLAPNGPYAKPHFHKEMTELFVVHSGEVLLTRGAEQINAKPGTALYVPPGIPHGFANVSDSPAELLISFTPGRNREKFFYGLADLLNSKTLPTEEELEKFSELHDQYRSSYF
ncbi:Cupin domain-containing protein [Actinopolyspora xinjiangensis]|uniref:Cupin domain-containing protein n=1 Tax=Actinopolyspora xinjiangensis TaxID=405564 RepID=A0A1H0WXC6_9ACTN|nr:cupin domain-containing protein [Actinopolyspora xinjiangensis]SDP95249.1 Cupin domain-containing protein [Actinopolyspora xinjiangensis]